MREKQLLNGLWDYRVGGGRFVKRNVPFSALPVGRSTCMREFDADMGEKKRAFLVFEGITYAAEVTLNGVSLGSLLAYAEYRFEVTDLLLPKGNRLSVELSDIEPAFGPSEGWENYGGIIRDVYLEYTGDAVIGDLLWHASFAEEYRSADCTLSVPIAADAPCTVLAELYDVRGGLVAKASAETADGKAELAFTVDAPELWSPAKPTLYRLVCKAVMQGVVEDGVEISVGFKDFYTKGKRFYLNGEPIFLLGINRHDIWGEQGHTMTEAQMRKDMMMIKSAGINYVRLVHYPHHKRILALADEYGLLVSEEPGLWWSDMHNKEICDGALEVMRRTVLRDRNHVSVAFWLSFNECIFTMEYLKDSVRVCRENDPYHMVSGANCMTIEMTKENYPACGFDFYTMHPYDTYLNRMKRSAEELTEMPLLFTEWGGHYCHNNPYLFREFIEYIISTWRNTEDKPVIAGACYWFWAEMYEFSRGFPACTEGVLREALVDANRNPLPDLEVFRNCFAKLYLPEEEPSYGFTLTAEVSDDGSYRPIPLSECRTDAENASAWDEMIALSKVPIPRYHHDKKKNRRMTVGPRLPEVPSQIGVLPVDLQKTPLVISEKHPVTVSVGKHASMLYLVGNTSMPKGYPIDGTYGEAVAVCTVRYTDGSEDSVVLRNGIDVSTATAQHGPSRINPLAERSPRVMQFHYHYDFEHYVVNLGRIAVDPQKEMLSFTLSDAGNGYSLLLYGVTVKE